MAQIYTDFLKFINHLCKSVLSVSKKIISVSLCLCGLFFQGYSYDAPVSNDVNRILFCMQSGNASAALNQYREYYKKIGRHDFEVLEKIGLILLDQGCRSSEPEHQLLTMYGAGVSLNEKALYILEEGMRSPQPQLQLVAMSFLSRYQNDNADAILNRALSSDSLIIRLEGAYLLAERGVTTALGQTESLMCKVDKSIWPVFPKIFAKIGTTGAIKILKKMLTNSDEKVRIAAILSAAENQRDDLLPNIRILATHHNLQQQEACAKALGVLKDETSIDKLIVLSNSNCLSVQLAACEALHHLGRTEFKGAIEEAAKAKNLFAITLLAEIPDSENLLSELAKDSDLQVRINATIALAQRKDPRCLISVNEILLRNARDLAFSVVSSAGFALNAYRAVPSARQNLEDDSSAEEMSLSIRTDLLTLCQQLPEKDFLKVCQNAFDYQQNDLVPTLVALLENMQTEGAIALLKKYLQKAGAPLIRNYCALALYRLKEPGPYKEYINNWVARQQKMDLIQLKPIGAWKGPSSRYKIAPQDASRLLIEAFEAITESQEDKGVNTLLDAIQYGNQKNKYVLAGLLLRIS